MTEEKAAKAKVIKVEISVDTIMYSNISKNKDGYNYARVVVKTGDKEYLSVSTEWEGDTIPSFAMDVMAMMKDSGSEIGSVREGFEEEYATYLNKGKEVK